MGGHDPHCACIGIQLCPTCHSWAHKYPHFAQLEGFIISAYEDEPWTVPVKTLWGWCINDCAGDSEWTSDPALSATSPAVGDN